MDTGTALAPGDHADVITAAGAAMADRFRRDGRLLAFGSGTAATDVVHIAVEFTHPGAVGKRALPAVPVRGDIAMNLRPLVHDVDIALGLTVDGDVAELQKAFDTARAAGSLTVAVLADADSASTVTADHVLVAGSADPHVAKELHVTCYHVLWELIQVYLERTTGTTTAASAASDPKQT